MKHLKIIYLFLIVLFSACSGNLPVKNEVVIHGLADPQMLNPVNFTDAQVAYISNHIFQKLIDVEFREPYNLVGILSESRPEIEKTPDGKMHLTFRLRKEAKWDDGVPVTTKDVDFTIKTIKCPLVNNPNARSYFDFMSDFKYYEDDQQKFTIVFRNLHFQAEAIFTDIYILPEYVYDPKGLMKNISVKMIAEKSDSLKSNSGSMKEFADDFNSEKRMRDPAFIGGCGAYKFIEWKTNERVVLVKKENWWGYPLEKENCFFEAYPEKLIFQTVKDQSSALVSLKAGNLDVMTGIKSKDFINLPKSEKFTQNFNAYTPMEYSYLYLALNIKKPILADKETRQALAYLTNVENIIQTIKYGQADQIVGPIHPSKKNIYNKNIEPYKYNFEKAKQLLEKAGWKNTNGDATLDKMIDGKHTEFIVDYLVNNGNDERKSVGIMLQAEAKKAGIAINVQSVDWAVMLEKCNKHDFDIMIGKLLSGPTPDDMKQTFHSTAATGEGANYANFSNAKADLLIDSIRVEIDEEKINGMYMRFQEILHEEVPMIFLYAPTERIAISKKFDNAYPSILRPGFWAQGFKLRNSGKE